MPPKRPLSGADPPGDGGRSRKEQRIAQRREARRIDVDGSRPAGENSSISGTKIGHSSSPTSVGASISMSTAPLPPQLDVEQFIASRQFEISSLQKAISSSRSSAATRAWQLLPRHARRRAASHNLLRLPSRLRRKGRAELKASNTVGKPRAQIRKRLANHPKSIALARKVELISRASRPHAKWLESHLWMAKRFRMSRPEFDGERWGYVLPEAAAMKGKRTDWRHAREGCVIYDNSYDEWIRVACKVAKGKERATESMEVDQTADRLSLPPSQRAQKLLEDVLQRAGVRALGAISSSDLSIGHVYDCLLLSGNPGPSQGIVAPLSVYSVPPTSATPSTSDSKASVEHDYGKAVKRPTSTYSHFLRTQLSLLPSPPPLSELYPDCEVLIRVHPAATRELRKAIKHAIEQLQKGSSELTQSAHFVVTHLRAPDAETVVGMDMAGEQTEVAKDGSTIEKGKGTKRSDRDRITSTKVRQLLADRQGALTRKNLRNRSFNTFELYGPLSGSILGGVLTPVASTSEVKKEQWKQLTTHLSRPCAASQEQRVVLHLRVHDPRLAFPHRNVKLQKGSAASWSGGNESISATERDLLSSDTTQHLLRDGMAFPHYTKGDLDRRRSQQSLPGSKLEPTSADDVIPIVLIQRWLPSATLPSNAPQHNSNVLGCTSGYTLLVPQGWSRPFLHSLLSTSARLVSHSSLQALDLERGVPSFPRDWVGCPGWEDWMAWEEGKRREQWERRPRGKRVERDEDGRVPFQRSPERVWADLVKNGRQCLRECLSSIPEADAAVQEEEKYKYPGSLHMMPTSFSSTGTDPKTSFLQQQMGLLASHVSTYTSSAPIKPLSSLLRPLKSRPSSHPFVLVRLTPAEGQRARMHSGAYLFSPLLPNLPQEGEKRWQSDDDDDDENDGESSASSTALIKIGKMTSADYSLSRGRYVGFGCVSREAWLSLYCRALLASPRAIRKTETETEEGEKEKEEEVRVMIGVKNLHSQTMWHVEATLVDLGGLSL